MIAKKRNIILKPIHANAGLAAVYKDKLNRLIAEMNDSVQYWLLSAYKRNLPIIALDADKVSKGTAEYRDFPSGKEHCKLCTMFVKPHECTVVRGTIYEWGWCKYFEAKKIAEDASPTQEIRTAFRKLARRWIKNWNEAANKLASYFTQSAKARNDAQMMTALKKAGIAVSFQTTPAIRNIMHATVQQNVALIKSIPQKYLSQVEVLVMQSVQQGGNLKTLSDELQKQFKVTKNRAALIATDQNKKATAAFTRARYVELGIKEAYWIHSGAGREPRPTHVANSGKKFNVRTGWYDPHENMHIQPGYLINCRCTSRPVITV
jgi:SPP1 gp7 family putative phage head morphogenesis protein